MSDQEDFLEGLVKKFDDLKIPYMLCGSVSSSLHGQPRATRDIDIVIAPTRRQVLDFVESLGQDYYVSLAAVQEAFARKSSFNVIENESGWKADLIIHKDREFSRKEFGRRCQVKINNLDVWTCSPEDTILTKLEWAKNSQSEQQFRDALGVAVVQWGHLDMNYLREWAKELQVESSLKELLDQAEKLTESK